MLCIQRFPRYRPIFKIAIEHEIWQLGKVPEVAHILSFYTTGSKLRYFLLYGQRFQRYGPLFRIGIFGHETSSRTKYPEVCTYTPFLPQCVEIELIFALSAAVSDSKLPYLGMKLDHWPKWQKLHRYSLSTPRGRNWPYICCMGSGVWDLGRFSKLPHFGMKLGNLPKVQKYTYTPLLQGVEIQLTFALRTAVSEIQADFQNYYIWPWNLGQLTKGPEVAHILSLYPTGTEFRLFSLYRQRFPRHGLSFEIAIFWEEIWPLANVPEVAYIRSFYPRGPNYQNCRKFIKIIPIIKIAILGHKTWPEFQTLHIYLLNYNQIPNLALRLPILANFHFSTGHNVKF